MSPDKDGRKGHYLKVGVGSTRPTVLFAVTVDAECLRCSLDPAYLTRVWREGWIHFTRRVKDRWSDVVSLRCSTPDSLFTSMHRLALPRYRNYVVSPAASDALTLAHFWERAEKGGVAWEPTQKERSKAKKADPDPNVTVFRRLVFNGKPDIIDYRHLDRRYVWVSGQQYLPCEEDAIAKSLGWRWPDTGGSDGYGQVVPRTARERGLLWLLAMQRLSEWWGLVSQAPWGLTCGQLAVGILRTHVPPRTLCTHTHKAVHELEGEGCFGARASTWYLGDIGRVDQYREHATQAPPPSRYGCIPGPLHSLDVRSMYPFLLREMQFPQRLKCWYLNPPPSWPQALARSHGVLACVTIQTRVPEYPLRDGDRIIWPTGTFTTVLTGPELLALRRDGRVVRCHRLALYQLGRPTAGAAAAMIAEREAARERGDHMWELFSKLLGNSMGGKLAQRKGLWVADRRHAAQVRWGQWHEVSSKGAKVTKYRSIAGLVWRWQSDMPGSGPFVAAFNYLTAYGRLHMRRLREDCPPCSIISQDTDGVWCTGDAVQSLKEKGWAFGDKAGELKQDAPMPAGRFYGPRHYWNPTGWTLSGFADGVMHADGQTVDYVERRNPLRCATERAPDTLLTIKRTGTLDLDTDGGEIDQWGWVHPPFRGNR